MKFPGLTAVGGGAAAGAWLRWRFGTALNPVFPTIPPGTLVANVFGSLLMTILGILFVRFLFSVEVP